MNLWTVGCTNPRLTAQASGGPLWTSRGKRYAFPPPCPQVGGWAQASQHPQQDSMNSISGNRETSSRLSALASPGRGFVQTARLGRSRCGCRSLGRRVVAAAPRGQAVPKVLWRNIGGRWRRLSHCGVRRLPSLTIARKLRSPPRRRCASPGAEMRLLLLGQKTLAGFSQQMSASNR